MIAYVKTSGQPSRTPGGAIDRLRTRLSNPVWDGWTAVDGSLMVDDFGTDEFIATTTLVRTVTSIKACPHGVAEVDDCTECTPF